MYGFFLIGSILVGTVYWIFTNCGGEATQQLMWAPGSGLIEPEPWLQDANGGYGGWSPSSSGAYAAWSPGAYLNLFTSTTIYIPTTVSTTRRTRRSRRTRLPPQLPPETDAPESPSLSSLSDENNKDDDIESDGQIKMTGSPEPKPIKEEDKFKKPVQPPEPDLVAPGDGGNKDTYEQPTTPIDYNFGYVMPQWRSRDLNEEAYEENPLDLVNTRRPDKFPVEGWGYDYDS